MDDRRSDSNIWAFFVGLFLGAVGIRQFTRISEKAANQVQMEADEVVLNTVVSALSRRLQIPTATLRKTIADHNHDPEAWRAIQEQYRGCALVFTNIGGAQVEATIEIQWAGGASTIMESTWPWDRLPLEIRGELLERQHPIKVNWEFPTTSEGDTGVKHE